MLGRLGKQRIREVNRTKRHLNGPLFAPLCEVVGVLVPNTQGDGTAVCGWVIINTRVGAAKGGTHPGRG